MSAASPNVPAPVPGDERALAAAPAGSGGAQAVTTGLPPGPTAAPAGALAADTIDPHGVAALARMPADAAAALLATQASRTTRQLARAAGVTQGRFEALGEEHELGPDPDWRRNPSLDAEWIISLHKLPFLVDLAQAWRAGGGPQYLGSWARLTASWLARMGIGELACSDAQVEAKRVEHCIVSLLLIEDHGGIADLPAGLVPALLERLADEAGYLLGHLKPTRNHRTFQLYAAFLAGVLVGPCLRGADRQARLRDQARQATELLCANLLQDFGADGVHCELSTHYHQITLETALSFVAVCRAADIELPEALHDRLQRALTYSAWITLPDGEIPLINDADNGEHRPLLALGAELYGDPALDHVATQGRFGTPPAELSRHFDAAGYVVMRNGWWRDTGATLGGQHLFYDCAALGQGSHAHYDLFSFCYSVGGRQLVVDPGRYTYNAEAGADGIDWRHRFKRTAAHNTVCIDGLDQTRYLSKARQPAAGLHRLDRAALGAGASKHGPAVERIAPRVRLGRRSDLVLATARSAEYAPLHTRCLVYVQRQYLLVLDRVWLAPDAPEPGRTHHAALHLQLAAHWLDRVQREPRPGGLDVHGESWRILVDAPGAEAELTRAWVSKSYGHKQPAPLLRVQRSWQGQAVFATLIAPEGDGFAVQALQSAFDADQARLTVTGTVAGRDFTDQFALAWQGTLAMSGPDYRCQAAYALERRVDGETDHLMLGGATGWLGRVPSRSSGLMPAPDAQGDLEW